METEQKLLSRMEDAAAKMGWKDSYFCGRAYVHTGTMARLRNGGTVSLRTVEKIEKLLAEIEAKEDGAAA